MRYALFILIILAGCDRNRVGFRDSHEPPKWSGTFTFAEGEARAQLNLKKYGEGLLTVTSSAVENVVLKVRLHAESVSKHEISLRCLEASVKSDGQLAYVIKPGGPEEWPRAELRTGIELFFDKTKEFLEKIPAAWRKCGGERVSVKRSLVEGPRVRLDITSEDGTNVSMLLGNGE